MKKLIIIVITVLVVCSCSPAVHQHEWQEVSIFLVTPHNIQHKYMCSCGQEKLVVEMTEHNWHNAYYLDILGSNQIMIMGAKQCIICKEYHTLPSRQATSTGELVDLGHAEILRNGTPWTEYCGDDCTYSASFGDIQMVYKFGSYYLNM